MHAVVLNWNGAADTLACLESLAAQKFPALRVMVVDNGSEDDSVARIKAWTLAHRDLQVDLVEAGENLGFAAGCNVGIRSALDAGAEHVLLLNNDATLEPGALEAMVRFLHDHPDFAAVVGQIRYAGRPVVWNCGGELTWFGSRRYLWGNQPADRVPAGGWRRITFITGCAALIRASVLRKYGLLTERFFFGEEDYEFSLRMKRLGLKMACVLDAVVHHRVGSSVDRAASPGALGRYYIYYLNRFIDMRAEYPRPVWSVWRVAWLAAALPRLQHARGFTWSSMWLLARRLLRDSTRLNGVNRQRFEAAGRSGIESL